jgi:hypothetical protein
MCPLSLSVADRSPQGPSWRRARRCLLKDCERWFQPTRPQCRYCSAKCRQAAKRWHGWRSQQKYRASPNGREHRQEQGRRYRQRCRTRPCPSAASPATVSPPADNSLAACEGKRLLQKSEKVSLRPCDRPGCYVLFPAGSEYNPRRFCCVMCRKALRCVLDREARYQRRRRRGLRQVGQRRRPWPVMMSFALAVVRPVA